MLNRHIPTPFSKLAVRSFLLQLLNTVGNGYLRGKDGIYSMCVATRHFKEWNYEGLEQDSGEMKNRLRQSVWR
ncbi:hypothetical protein EYF80_015870 [Liparis tanakae]|uniref:Uncharacterized protein n=1 Tax=Liparis tanakae TaxID=230148 RepID=A0A4Z2I9Q4_9TELE|nr:hypothetical protein EYF80_015870 [Liparis tanakae]